MTGVTGCLPPRSNRRKEDNSRCWNLLGGVTSVSFSESNGTRVTDVRSAMMRREMISQNKKLRRCLQSDLALCEKFSTHVCFIYSFL